MYSQNPRIPDHILTSSLKDQVSLNHSWASNPVGIQEILGSPYIHKVCGFVHAYLRDI